MVSHPRRPRKKKVTTQTKKFTAELMSGEKGLKAWPDELADMRFADHASGLQISVEPVHKTVGDGIRRADYKVFLKVRMSNLEKKELIVIETTSRMLLMIVEMLLRRYPDLLEQFKQMLKRPLLTLDGRPVEEGGVEDVHSS